MVEVKNIEVFGLERSCRAISNSYNVGEIDTTKGEYKEKLANTLGSSPSGSGHNSFLRGITVYFDLKADTCFLSEFQRYSAGINFIMSQSSMHSLEKFMNSDYDPYSKYVDPRIKEIVREKYNAWHKAKEERDEYHSGFQVQDVHAQKENDEKYEKLVYESFMELVSNLPRGFELWSTHVANYQALQNIVRQRFGHKQKENWGNFIKACYSMPKFRELCGFTDSKWDLENW